MLKFLEISCIEADSSDVIEVMRSPEPVALTKGKTSLSTLGYLCAIKQENRQVVYAGLYVREIQRSLIYTIEGNEAARREGEEFLAGLGFRLEPVALKFSSAMREVILREIPVILSPEAAQKNRRDREKRLAEWRRLIDEPEAEAPTDGPELSLAEWTQRKRDRDALAAAKKSAAENLIAEERIAEKAATLREIIDDLLHPVEAGEAAAAERAERKRLQATLVAVQAEVAEMQTKTIRLEEELATVKTERDSLAQEKKVAGALLAECRRQLAQAENAREREAEERKVSDLARKDAEKRFLALQETAKNMHAQLTSGKAENARLLKEKEAAERLLAELQQKLEKTEEKNRAEAATRQQAGDDKNAKKLATKEEELSLAKERIATSEKERSQLATALELAEKRVEEFAAGKAENARLLKEKEATERLLAELQQKLEKAEEENRTGTQSQQTSDELLAKKLATAEEELSLAKERIATSEKERSQLARALDLAEKRLTEMAANPAGGEAAGDTDERVRQLQTDLRQANERSEFLRLEIDRLATAKATAEIRLATLEAGGRASESALASALASTPPVVPTSSKSAAASPANDPPPHVVRRPPPPDAVFHVDWDLAGVPYSSPEEIQEIRQSVNRVRLSLEGYPDQYCSVALVVAEAGGKRNVYIVFRLSTSNRVLVYIPVNLPQSPAAFAKTLKEAEKFIQVIGLDIDPVELSKEPEERAKTLESIAVLKHQK